MTKTASRSRASSSKRPSSATEASEDLKLKPFKHTPDLMRLLNRVGEKPPTGEKGGGKDEGGAEPQEGPKKPDDETKDGGK